MIQVFAPSLLSTVVALISSAASTYGPTIAKYGSLVLETINKDLPAVTKVVETVSTLIGISDCEAQQLGAKAGISEKKPEDFDSFNEYINHLETEVELDTNYLAANDSDTLSQLAVGISILLTGIGGALNTKISLPLLSTATVAGFPPAVIIEVIKAYDRNGINGDDFSGYIANILPLADAEKHRNALVEAFLCSNPAMTVEQAEDAIMALC